MYEENWFIHTIQNAPSIFGMQLNIMTNCMMVSVN